MSEVLVYPMSPFVNEVSVFTPVPLAETMPPMVVRESGVRAPAARQRQTLIPSAQSAHRATTRQVMRLTCQQCLLGW
jgi:hypothetical protein